MQTLIEIVNADGIRPNVIQDVVTILDGEVARKSGASGFAIRKAFQVVKKIDSGNLLMKAIDKLLDRFIVSIEPYYQSYALLDGSTRPSFQHYLVQQDGAVAEALLAVTDNVRQGVDNKLVTKAYDRLRPSALGHVREAIPAVGQLIQKYT